MSVCQIQWHLYQDKEGRVRAIEEQNHVSHFLACALARLEPKLEAGADVAAFLSPGMEQFYDPFLLLDMDRACARIFRAVSRQEPIRIVTDYDVDGTTSSLIIQAALRILGHRELSYHIPHRKEEGYGFSLAASQKAVADGIGLVITADIGVRDEAAIAYAKAHGVDVIVLDHHLLEGCTVPPSAYAVVCPPQARCRYPNSSLAACGISIKLAQALLKENPRCDQYIRSMCKLAALGTVADVVSLRELENRAIVATGLAALNHDDNNAGISALLNVSNLAPGYVDASKIAFNLAPKINAAGRMSTATLVIELINAKNRVQAQGLAEQLRMFNNERKNIQEFMVKTAELELSGCDAPFLFVVREESDTWHAGIAGIVAGRLRERFNRPVAVATFEGEFVVGSIRSTPGVHALEALVSVRDLLVKYGGHRAAAGMTFYRKNLERIRERLSQNAVMQLHGMPEMIEETYIADFSLKDISTALFDDLDRLEPCGSKNPRPFIRIRDVNIKNVMACKNGSMRAILQGDQIALVAWIGVEIPVTQSQLTQNSVNLYGMLEKDYFNGIQYCFKVVDVSLAGT